MAIAESKPNIEAGETEKEDVLNKGPLIGIRHVQSLMMFLLLAVGYAMRVNLSVAIVSMTNTNQTDSSDVPVYDWEDSKKNYILSSFFMGYITLQVLAGELGKRYGVKWFLVAAMGINSAACMLTRIMADTWGWKGVIAIRILQGMFQGFFFPSVHNIIGKWAPKEERSTIGNFVFTGVAFGTIIAMPITGVISASHYGWPLAFQVFGAAGIVWCVLWIIIGSNNPASHKYISKEEQFYIESSLEQVAEEEAPPTPWKAILTSAPVWAIVVANFGQNWGYSVLLTEIPSYLSNVAGLNIEKSSYLATAPYVALFILGLIFGPIADWLVVAKMLSAKNVRKLMNTIGSVGPAIALVVLGFIPRENVVAIVALLIIAVGINAAIWCGFQVNHVDLSPKFSGILMGIGNGSSNIFSIVSPLFVNVLVSDQKDPDQWRWVFILAAVVYIASDIFYLIFAQAERQWWDPVDEKPKESITTDTTLPVVDEEKKSE